MTGSPEGGTTGSWHCIFSGRSLSPEEEREEEEIVLEEGRRPMVPVGKADEALRSIPSEPLKIGAEAVSRPTEEGSSPGGQRE